MLVLPLTSALSPIVKTVDVGSVLLNRLFASFIPPVEFTFKDELIRNSIEKSQLQIDNIEENVEEIKEAVKKLDERIYQLTK